MKLTRDTTVAQFINASRANTRNMDLTPVRLAVVDDALLETTTSTGLDIPLAYLISRYYFRTQHFSRNLKVWDIVQYSHYYNSHQIDTKALGILHNLFFSFLSGNHWHEGLRVHNLVARCYCENAYKILCRKALSQIQKVKQYIDHKFQFLYLRLITDILDNGHPIEITNMGMLCEISTRTNNKALVERVCGQLSPSILTAKNVMFDFGNRLVAYMLKHDKADFIVKFTDGLPDGTIAHRAMIGAICRKATGHKLFYFLHNLTMPSHKILIKLTLATFFAFIRENDYLNASSVYLFAVNEVNITPTEHKSRLHTLALQYADMNPNYEYHVHYLTALFILGKKDLAHELIIKLTKLTPEAKLYKALLTENRTYLLDVLDEVTTANIYASVINVDHLLGALLFKKHIQPDYLSHRCIRLYFNKDNKLPVLEKFKHNVNK